MIPVQRRLPNGQATDHPFLGQPCIEIGFSFNTPTKLEDRNLKLTGLKYRWALLDTGADFNLISEDLIPHGAKCVQDVQNNGVTGTVQARVYEITFHIREKNIFHQTGCSSMPYRENRGFDIILGRKFLQCTRFTYEFHHGIQAIEFVHNPNAI